MCCLKSNICLSTITGGLHPGMVQVVVQQLAVQVDVRPDGPRGFKGRLGELGFDPGKVARSAWIQGSREVDPDGGAIEAAGKEPQPRRAQGVVQVPRLLPGPEEGADGRLERLTPRRAPLRGADQAVVAAKADPVPAAVVQQYEVGRYRGAQGYRRTGRARRFRVGGGQPGAAGRFRRIRAAWGALGRW